MKDVNLAHGSIKVRISIKYFGDFSIITPNNVWDSFQKDRDPRRYNRTCKISLSKRGMAPGILIC